MKFLYRAAFATLTITLASAPAFAQTAAQQPAAQASQPPQLKNLAPAGTVNPAFPAVEQRFFTADAPAVDTVNSFLKQLWGYDPNRVWQVEAVQKTKVPGISHVVVYVGERGSEKIQSTQFLVLPDQKHAIAGDTVINFGATPFADDRAILLARATGPAHGAASKDLLLVEFSDLQCPHCKEAQSKMDQLLADFPSARIVYQNFPITELHPAAFLASAYSLCVAQQKPDADNAAFFSYVQAVFDTQAALTADNTVQTLNNAVIKAGLDSAKVAACADTQPIKDAVNADIKLANDMVVESTPTLYVNGRPVPLGDIPYETLKTIVNYQAMLDGVKGSSAAPSLNAPPSLK